MNWMKIGLLDNNSLYYDMLNELVKNVSHDEEQGLSELIREVIFDMNILTRDQVEKDINQYMTYPTSEALKRFLKISLRFIELTVEKPEEIVKNFVLYGDEAKKLWRTTDECVALIILDKVIDYTNGLE